MLRSEFKVDRLVFKKTLFRKALDEALYDAVLKIAVVWLRTALHSVDGTFPVKTGMAKASFQALARFLQEEGKRVAFDIIGVDYSQVKAGKKSISEGKRQSKKDKFVVVLRNQYGPFQYSFDWWTNIAHFIQNESNEAPARLHLIHKTPWWTIDQATTAAREYLPIAFKQLPKLKDYVSVTSSGTIKNG